MAVLCILFACSVSVSLLFVFFYRTVHNFNGLHFQSVGGVRIFFTQQQAIYIKTSCFFSDWSCLWTIVVSACVIKKENKTKARCTFLSFSRRAACFNYVIIQIIAFQSITWKGADFVMHIFWNNAILNDDLSTADFNDIWSRKRSAKNCAAFGTLVAWITCNSPQLLHFCNRQETKLNHKLYILKKCTVCNTDQCGDWFQTQMQCVLSVCVCSLSNATQRQTHEHTSKHILNEAHFKNSVCYLGHDRVCIR